MHQNAMKTQLIKTQVYFNTYMKLSRHSCEAPLSASALPKGTAASFLFCVIVYVVDYLCFVVLM